MTIGSSLFLIAIGAIARYAIADSWDAVDLTTIGLILMVVGVVGLLIGIWQTFLWDRGERGAERRRYRDEPPA